MWPGAVALWPLDCEEPDDPLLEAPCDACEDEAGGVAGAADCPRNDDDCPRNDDDDDCPCQESVANDGVLFELFALPEVFALFEVLAPLELFALFAPFAPFVLFAPFAPPFFPADWPAEPECAAADFPACLPVPACSGRPAP